MAVLVKSKQPLVSVIIPVYNCEEYIQECLDSIYSQTYSNYEIILVNDGSTDGSLKLLRANAKKHAGITLIDQRNMGQGYTRNHALQRAAGEYVLFVDADDYIEAQTLELVVARAEVDKADAVHFDWKMLSRLPDGTTHLSHFNSESFSHRALLVGAECDEFMDMRNYFSVNNLFRKEFLLRHNIRYDEGHIYEDVLFVVSVANRAERISLIHDPLYVVRKNDSSTTHSHITTDKHYRDFLRAVRLSFDRVEPRMEHTHYLLAGYFLEKFIVYYEKRVPRRLRSSYLKDFVDIMSTVTIKIPARKVRKRFLEVCIRREVFAKRKYSFFRGLVLHKTTLLPLLKKVKR
ncbi:MAG: glycosyltransferase [Candidatus Saccharibacteria bacterium]|nr:MAG: glycosyltransferase [Candidatus Saccharibacteria bacterium]